MINHKRRCLNRSHQRSEANRGFDPLDGIPGAFLSRPQLDGWALTRAEEKIPHTLILNPFRSLNRYICLNKCSVFKGEILLI